MSRVTDDNTSCNSNVYYEYGDTVYDTPSAYYTYVFDYDYYNHCFYRYKTAASVLSHAQ
jgi:hypothetical protein